MVVPVSAARRSGAVDERVEVLSDDVGCTGVLAGLPRHLRQVAGMSVFCLKEAEQAVGLVECWWWDQARASLDGGGCRRRVLALVRKSLGRRPGRWVNADGFIPSPATGVYFDSFKASVRWGSSSSWFRLWFSSSAVAGGDDFRHLRITVGLGTLLQFSFLSGSSVKFGLHCSLCILAVRFCMCMRTCMLSLSRNTETYYQKKKTRHPGSRLRSCPSVSN